MSAFPPPPPPPPQRSNSTATILIAVALVLVLGITVVGVAGWATYAYLTDADSDTGVTAPPPEPSATVQPPSSPADLARYYEQKLKWRSCGDNQCSRLTVPLSYDDPDGESIELAVLRAPAAKRGQRVGQLVVNPGGPGGSGVQYAASGPFVFGDRLTDYFDIVGFDPRGVGKSTPLECAGTEQTDEFLSLDPDPDTPDEEARFDQLTREFGEGCLKNSGDLAKHMTTPEVAKDLDILRAALGERQLDYFGASYGTSIGATYADLFPTHVRRMVLDGAIDPTLSTLELSLGQAHGFEIALRAYLQDCVDQGDCLLGDTVDAGAQRIRQLLEDLDETPLPTASGRELTEGLAQYGIILPLYNQDYWPLLTVSLQQALEGGGDRLLNLADQYASREEGKYKDNSIEAYYAVYCLDHSDFVPSDRVPGLLDQFEKASPTFGRIFAYGATACGSWPVKSGAGPRLLEAEGAAPIVVVGTTRDPATPYEQAVTLAKQLESGVFVSRDGDGHTGFQQGNACVDKAIEGYLIGGTVPKDGLSC
ncbi:MAG: alpha/beta hydrolase [Marmoricola sp.]